MNNKTVFRPFYRKDTSADRERIAQQTADFLANGGEIVEVPMGATARNFSAHKDSKNRHRWNEGRASSRSASPSATSRSGRHKHENRHR